MPIYSYRCTSCGNQRDVLQKISDATLDTCPVCGAATFKKQVTAAGFQLKGSGWYVTDFRNPASKPATAKADQAGQGAGGTTDKPAGDAADTKSPTPAAAPADSGVAAQAKSPAAPAATPGGAPSVAK